MSRHFKILMTLLVVPIIGYGISYLINESPVAFSRTEKNPKCTFDCGFSPTDFVDSTKHIGFPLTYQDKVTYLPEHFYTDTTSEPYNNKLVENYIIIISISELIASAVIVWKVKYAHNRH